MSEYVLRTKNLTKKYGNNTVLDHINMDIKRGEIYGFIGLNGAGKSTLMRLITGLTFPTSGEMELFGNSGEKQLSHMRKRLGVLIENPGLFPHLTARQNLEIIRIQRGIPNQERIEKVLAMVGLINIGKKKVKKFSLGMKQRLGIAMALLTNPEFLILDEPTNGLDPKGVIEIRELLKKLNSEYGITVLISSHILSEVHQLVTRLGIIHQGKLIEQITAKELDDKCRAHLVIKTNDVAKTVAILETELQTTNFKVIPGEKVQLFSHLRETQEVGKVLMENGLIIEQMMLKNESLEDYFTNVIGEVRTNG